MFWNKKGISPLIATVLIIGFTVALAAIIMTWGQTFSKGMQQSTEQTTDVQLACAQDVLFEIQSACADGDNLKMTVANNGQKALVNLTARIKKDETTIDVLELDGIDAFGLKIYDKSASVLSNVESAKNVTEIELIPIINVGGKEVTCSSAIAKYGDVVKGEKLSSC